MILELEVCFPGGRFHGEEWPPEPARLFQALVAATHLGAHRLHRPAQRDAALRWLENLAAPVILADEAAEGCALLDNYVPNNDDHPGPNAHVRAAKTLAAYSFPAGGAVAYRWKFDDAAGHGTNHADTVAAMASLLTHFGQTTDGVFARGRVWPAGTDPQDPAAARRSFQPREVPGGRWRVPATGFFDLLQRRYPRSVSSEPPDFTNSRQVDYVADGQASAIATVPMVIFDLLRLDGEKPLPFAPQNIRQPAGLVRGALMEWAGHSHAKDTFGSDNVARFLAGHRAAADPAPSENNGHFGVVPLPSLNQAATADGELRRVAFIGWGANTPLVIELFEEAARALHGATLRESRDEGRPCGVLARTPSGAARHWRAFWSGPARRWRSVTPVVLPGQLRRGRPPETLVARALRQAGIPAEMVESVAAFTGPLVPNTCPAREYRLGDYLSTTPRRHVEILFREPVRGPLVLGRGRYAGLGLCLPVVGEVSL